MHYLINVLGNLFAFTKKTIKILKKIFLQILCPARMRPALEAQAHPTKALITESSSRGSIIK